jgi:hypothetical protein
MRAAGDGREGALPGLSGAQRGGAGALSHQTDRGGALMYVILVVLLLVLLLGLLPPLGLHGWGYAPSGLLGVVLVVVVVLLLLGRL